MYSKLRLRTVASALLLYYCLFFGTSLTGGLLERKRIQRAFHRLVTGLQIAQNCKAFMRFMTLTSIKYPKYELKDGFDVLRLRIERARLNRDGFHGFKFNRYFCIRTSEGNGVLHIIYWGRYIPQDWLRRQWMDINGAFKVDIRQVWDKKNKRMGGLVGYLITNYLTEQPIKRMSYGWKWAWLGFCKSWKVVRENYGNLRRWRLPYKEGARATWMDKFKDCSWEAWWTFLHGDRATTRKVTLARAWNYKDEEYRTPVILAVYGLPVQRKRWVGQATLFSFHHGFAT